MRVDLPDAGRHLRYKKLVTGGSLTLARFSLCAAWLTLAAGTAALAGNPPSRGELALQRARNPARMRQLLEEARKRFTCNGEPISVSMIKAMEPFWTSDACEPYVLSVDVNMGMNTNRFSSHEKESREEDRGMAWVRLTSNEDERAYWRCARAGRLRNGLTILILNEDSAGSMPAQTHLMAVDFSLEPARAEDGKPYQRLVMTNRAYSGFTISGPVEIKGNTVWGGPAGNRIHKTIDR